MRIVLCLLCLHYIIIASYLFRCVTKAKIDVTHTADAAKCRLRRITHSSNITELNAT